MTDSVDTSSKASSKSNGTHYSQLSQSHALRTSLYGISQLLNTGLSSESLNICVQLIEAGVHPQALAEVITKIRQETSQRQQPE